MYLNLKYCYLMPKKLFKMMKVAGAGIIKENAFYSVSGQGPTFSYTRSI